MSIVHCKKEPYDVYIGRGRDPRSGEPGRWGNPFRIGPCDPAALDGRTLGCWCAPPALPRRGPPPRLGIGGEDARRAAEHLLGASALQARRTFRAVGGEEVSALPRPADGRRGPGPVQAALTWEPQGVASCP
jgi:hypothetical protein